jgi:hypothetical protein
MRNWLILTLSVVVGFFTCALTIFLTAGGEGTYVPAIILFPYWMILLSIFGRIEILSPILLSQLQNSLPI